MPTHHHLQGGIGGGGGGEGVMLCSYRLGHRINENLIDQSTMLLEDLFFCDDQPTMFISVPNFGSISPHCRVPIQIYYS
jgi:hypothetical protein